MNGDELRSQLKTISDRLYDLTQNLTAWQLTIENRLGMGNARFEAIKDQIKAVKDLVKGVEIEAVDNRKEIKKVMLADRKWAAINATIAACITTIGVIIAIILL